MLCFFFRWGEELGAFMLLCWRVHGSFTESEMTNLFSSFANGCVAQELEAEKFGEGIERGGG